ncbi:lysophospholipid acyltransferase family protein [Sediminibacterium ginsengisoli]|uniref:1-acyl-sn-glycerol-3-phosphate acyltransferase n=1 Tax=Sediminibacterium ginsengisoli TaxID=413434 RepID=A0A1T4L4Q1_9BACT|nr:lysophospholipid acyltransferase family protein [Sediminibacterium ginsengisoli]SJZ49521.1 1-acyl-sn-glycerol-3-phosphate acyltransferase [Sediminibacterium ginsengisoli]
MKGLIRLAQYIYCVYALLMFVILMFLVFPFVLLSLLFGKLRGGNMIYGLCMLWAKAWYLLTGIRHKEIHEAPHDTSRQYIFVANHISYMDIPPLVLIAHQPIRILGKYEMVKIPVFGWIYRAAVILVDRRNAETRARSVRALKSALKHGISIFIFPEGTFNETGQPLKSFFDGAFRIAIETQTSIKPVLLPDTIDRLHYRGIFELTPGINRVIYLEEIPVTGMTPEDIPALKELVYRKMEAGLRRYRNYPAA